MKTSRRTFFAKTLCLASAATMATTTSPAFAQPAVLESDPTAQALGYHADSAKVDAKKYPNRASSQTCSGCALYQGSPTATTAVCAALGGKQVNGKGWCSAWSKRA